jgi:hypothetical protein
MTKGMMRMASALSALMLGACSVVGVRAGTPEPHYAVVSHVGPVEIRRYDARLAAETTVQSGPLAARSQGFERLAGYIFGRNIAMTAPVAQAAAPGSAKIAMTAPVAQAASGADGWTIRFFMPANYTEATLPRPTNPAIRIVSLPPETYAVLRFTGARDPQTVADKQAELLRDLRGSAWQAVGDPVAWFYDPPWTLPPFRRNEVAVQVKQ